MLGWVLRYLGWKADSRAIRTGRVGRRIVRRTGYKFLRKL